MTKPAAPSITEFDPAGPASCPETCDGAGIPQEGGCHACHDESLSARSLSPEQDNAAASGGTEAADFGSLQRIDAPELTPQSAARSDGKPLVYLGCPYSHPDRAVRVRRFEASNRAAAQLMGAGVYLYAPISHTHPIAEAGDLPKGWDYWGAYDRAVLSCCHKLIVLREEGWQDSKGIAGELAIAAELGIAVEYMEPVPASPAPLARLGDEPPLVQAMRRGCAERELLGSMRNRDAEEILRYIDRLRSLTPAASEKDK